MASKPLVIVESQAKAETLAETLGDSFVVVTSAYRAVEVVQVGLGIDTEKDFQLSYEPPAGAAVSELKAALKSASEVFLATDPDGAGEVLAWHLRECLAPKVSVRRVVLHELTPRAIRESMATARDVDLRAVDAHEARRTVDRLFAHSVAPALWRKLKGGLPAARMTLAVARLLVHRELERMNAATSSSSAVTAPEVVELSAPFTTSTLLQQSGRLGLSAEQLMETAQELYERGYITFTRADSTRLSESAREAIRPAGDTFKTPEVAGDELQPTAFRLYELIWNRTIASQRVDARSDVAAEPVQVTPPARFTEATLLKELERLRIGRAATLAPLLARVRATYAWKKDESLIPQWDAFFVVKLMEKYFPELVDFRRLAELDEAFERIAKGELARAEFLREYFKRLPTQADIEKIDSAAINSTPIGGEATGIVVKPGRYGPYLKRGDSSAMVPDALPPDELTVTLAEQLFAAPPLTRR